MNPKQLAAEAALDYVNSDSVIGLGTGSTAAHFLDALGQALKGGRVRNVRGVPSSKWSEQRARQLGIPLTDLASSPVLDATFDGADEVTPELNLIKGLGGALLREKIVAQHSRRFVIMIDSSKRVDTLGTKGPLPVEVATFGHEAQARFLQELGGTPQLRLKDDGSTPYVTDNGNYIYHTSFPGIPDPDALDLALSRRAGILESGLFLNLATLVLIGTDTGVITLKRPT